jgi:hypothetical protein
MKSFEDKEEEEYEYLDEKQVKKLISRLVFEIEKLKDENESLWFMLEELEQSDTDGKQAISESLKNLKIYKEAFNKKPAEA